MEGIYWCQLYFKHDCLVGPQLGERHAREGPGVMDTASQAEATALACLGLEGDFGDHGRRESREMLLSLE